MNIFLRLSLLNPTTLKAVAFTFVLSIILMFFVKGIKKMLSKKRKQFIVYLLVSILLFSLTGLLSNDKILNDVPLNKFIGFQILFFLIGILNVFVLRRFFNELSEKKNEFVNEFAFTIVICLISMIGFILVSSNFQPEFAFHYVAASLWFLVPLLVVKCYEFSVSIPLPVHKKWFYPIEQRIDDPTNNELVNPLVISFEFERSLKSKETSNFRLKAPEKMEFGKLFYFFINDYNERHPEHKIQFLSDKKDSQGWIFYKKPKWFSSMKYIDHARTVNGNNIKEDDVIICRRV